MQLAAHFTTISRRLSWFAPEPNNLVVLDAERESIEETFATSRPAKPNRAERAATDLVIKALATKAYPDDIAHPYRLASKVCASLELGGARISRETVAQKLKAALSATVHAAFIPRIE